MVAPVLSPARDGLAEGRLRELVDLAVRGDTDAFGRLYDHFADAIYRYFYYHVGSASDAEDLLSRAFLRAWRSIHTFSWRGKPFEAWLFTLAHHQLVDFYRENKRSHEPIDESFAETQPGPESRAIAVAEATATRAALAKLTEEQRQVVVLKFYLDQDNKQIAAIMGKREGTVRALQMRALAALRRHLTHE